MLLAPPCRFSPPDSVIYNMRAYYGYTYYRPRHKRYSYMTGNDVEYTYGTSGNETGRFLFWTEDCYGCEHRLCQSNEVSNRMHAAVDEKYSSYYVYDHSGERRESRDQSQARLSYAETKQSVRSDHLGSASWITDNGGLAVQHLQYLPYGERYVDQRAAGYHERFTFTGKERDEETGYGYFGARYMGHELMTMWLSVDPMADKYPSISPYAYCAWNPVKLVDPDGKELADFFDRQGNYLGNDGKNDGKVYMLKEGFRAKTEDTRINWGGTLDPKHVDQIIASSDEITMNSDIGMLSRLLYSEFRGQSGNEQRVCADIVLNRVDDSKFPNTLEGVITQKQQFSSLNENDKNRKYFDNPSATLNNSSNIEAWRNCVSSAISVSNGYSRGISCDATLYYSPRSMKPKGSMPQWNYKLLKEVYPQGVNSNNIRCFKYK